MGRATWHKVIIPLLKVRTFQHNVEKHYTGEAVGGVVGGTTREPALPWGSKLFTPSPEGRGGVAVRGDRRAFQAEGTARGQELRQEGTEEAAGSWGPGGQEGCCWPTRQSLAEGSAYSEQCGASEGARQVWEAVRLWL